jgi:Integrase core domain
MRHPYVESVGGRLRDELLTMEAFSTLLAAQMLVEDWRIEDNTIRPHSTLGSLPPTASAKDQTTNHLALQIRLVWPRWVTLVWASLDSASGAASGPDAGQQTGSTPPPEGPRRTSKHRLDR